MEAQPGSLDGDGSRDLGDDATEVQCLCPLRGSGETVVYDGPLLVGNAGAFQTFHGSLVFERDMRSGLYARFEGSFAEYGHLSVTDGDAFSEVRLPSNPSFNVQSDPVSPEDAEKPPELATIPISIIDGGDLNAVDHFLIGCSTYFTPLLPLHPVGKRLQRQQRFSLPGWDLVLAVAAWEGKSELVVKAIPASAESLDKDRLSDLAQHLFYLLSLIASREVGIGPVLGMSREGSIAWARFSSARGRPGSPGFRWCPKRDEGEALASISIGFSAILQDPALTDILERSVEAFAFANSSEVLDVRIPIVCTALETLAWAYLRRWEGFGRKAMKDMRLGEMLRRLLDAARVPTQLPEHFRALGARAQSVPELQNADAPEVLAHVRNALVHPPKSLRDPEWPTQDQLIEAWQLSTWYLELVLLCWLRYEGQHLPRTDLGHGTPTPQLVPWVRGDSEPAEVIAE